MAPPLRLPWLLQCTSSAVPVPSHMASEQTQSTFEAFSTSEQFQSSFRADPVPSHMASEQTQSTFETFSISEQFQSSFRAVPEQFQCNLEWLSKLQLKFLLHLWRFQLQCSCRAVLEQFQSNFRAISVTSQTAIEAAVEISEQI